MNTDNWEKWFTAFDVSNHGGTLMVGDNNGNVTLMTKSGKTSLKHVNTKKIAVGQRLLIEGLIFDKLHRLTCLQAQNENGSESVSKQCENIQS